MLTMILSISILGGLQIWGFLLAVLLCASISIANLTTHYLPMHSTDRKHWRIGIALTLTVTGFACCLGMFFPIVYALLIAGLISIVWLLVLWILKHPPRASE